MTDEYGYAAAAQAGLSIFETTLHGSGRTARMLERVRPGDLIIVSSVAMKRYVEGKLADIGKTVGDGHTAAPHVRVRVIEPTENPCAHLSTLADGRVFFDHHWQLIFFANAIRRAERDLEQISAAISKTWPAAPRQEDRPEINQRFPDVDWTKPTKKT